MLDSGERDDIFDFRMMTKDLMYDLRMIVGPRTVVNTCTRAMGNANFQGNLHAVEAVFSTLISVLSESAAKHATPEGEQAGKLGRACICHCRSVRRIQAEIPDILGLAERTAIATEILPNFIPFLQKLAASQKWYLQNTVFRFIEAFADWLGAHAVHNRTAFNIVVQGVEHKSLLDECVPAFLAMCQESSRLIASQPTVVVRT